MHAVATDAGAIISWKVNGTSYHRHEMHSLILRPIPSISMLHASQSATLKSWEWACGRDYSITSYAMNMTW